MVLQTWTRGVGDVAAMTRRSQGNRTGVSGAHVDARDGAVTLIERSGNGARAGGEKPWIGAGGDG